MPRTTQPVRSNQPKGWALARREFRLILVGWFMQLADWACPEDGPEYDALLQARLHFIKASLEAVPESSRRK